MGGSILHEPQGYVTRGEEEFKSSGQTRGAQINEIRKRVLRRITRVHQSLGGYVGGVAIRKMVPRSGRYDWSRAVDMIRG